MWTTTGTRRRLTEDSIRLVLAEDESAAMAKSTRLGKEAEHDYRNEDGARVSWPFVSVIDVQEFCADDFHHRVEVYSRFAWNC